MYPNRLDDVSIRMRREYTKMGRVVKVMVDMLVKMFGHMLTDGIGVWAAYFDQAMIKGGISCFVDGTLRPHCRPVGDRNHGIKFLGVVLPNGITADLRGPTAGCCLDGCLMQRSRLSDKD
ncbi:unnamed protein product [Discosporangium mesarthrocarpum]